MNFGSFEEEQGRFSIATFDDLINKPFNVDTPPGLIVWHPQTTEISFTNLSSTDSIAIQNSLTINSFLKVRCYHHGALVIPTINRIYDILQIDTLIEELTNYLPDSVEIGNLFFLFVYFYKIL